MNFEYFEMENVAITPENVNVIDAFVSWSFMFLWD